MLVRCIAAGNMQFPQQLHYMGRQAVLRDEWREGECVSGPGARTGTRTVRWRGENPAAGRKRKRERRTSETAAAIQFRHTEISPKLEDI
jgi:hypothetical protein